MTVSILLATYNVAPYVGRAIESVIRQSYRDWELIVADDCSTDRTAAAVQAYAKADGRIRFFQRPENGGPGAARNTCLDHATGEWIAILDGDDAWLPERLERLLRWAERTSADFIADDLIQYDMAADVMLGPAGRFRHRVQTIDFKSFFENKSRGARLGYGALKPIVRRRAVTEHGIRYKPHLRYGEDFRFYIDLFAHGAKGILVSNAYYIYTLSMGPRSGKRSPASRTIRREEITLALIDDIIADYAGAVAPDVRRAMLNCRDRVLDCVLVDELRARRLPAGRLGEIAFLMGNPRMALARFRRLFYTARKAMR